ncbi:ABC transporter substrate-binding protein [Arthrobacter sp. MSA 4-2]|uniref:ABC transporter substrate-binding protein n=1 Tax=Arthrobacter sp. MSA 4-2 TaxID=2794349 RepID=UPI0018E72E56|nr:ABC transporter substrate-binding protein [Arthrobacter sp. MSA 4-2]MBJ2121184.1 ABC transporter substrate-binding protein [Arthrobacter sp. MSA 4-2]
MRTKSAHIGILAIATITVLSGCSDADAADPGGQDLPEEIRLGYFPNLTHAPALVAEAEGLYDEHLDGVDLQTQTFSAGPEAIEALFSGAIDMTVIGPNPTINGFSQSQGKALKVLAGVASGGAGLVVRPGIDSAEDLKGATLATPQLGNTQDVALRTWLEGEGLTADTEGGGDVSIQPQENSAALQSFVAGDIDGAWVPEPWLTRLIEEGDGQLLVDEGELWPGGRFVVANLIVRTEFLEEHPETVQAVLEGHLDALAFMEEDPEGAQKVFNDKIEEITGQRVKDEYLDVAWENVEFTYDPLPETLVTGADHAVSVGLLEKVELEGLYTLDPLNTVLKDRGLTGVKEP